MEPNRFPRRILLCAAGLSPQIVTETLYALSVERTPPFVPHEIHLITTGQGATSARLTLLDPDQGYFHRLCADYRLDPAAIRFGNDTIHVIRERNGSALEDIRTRDDNEAAADAITTLVRELTHDPNSAIHASIAGGRKTLGFYLGYALSLFGRPQDRLSHVLVSPPFESHTEFFFPPRKPKVLFTRENPSRPVRTDEAQITLAPIPFVRMRDGLTEVMREGGASFSAAVRQAQRSLEPAELVLDPAARRVRCGGVNLALTPVDFAFYAWFARRAQEGLTGIQRKQAGTAEANEFLAEYRVLCSEYCGDYERVENAVLRSLQDGSFAKYFDERKAHLHRKLRTALGHGPAERYAVNSHGRGDHRGYALSLKPEQIRFSDLSKEGEHDEH